MHCFRAWRRLAELTFVCVLSSLVWAQGLNNVSKRPFTFEDMMALKRVAEPVVSPDGKWVVFSAVDVNLESLDRSGRRRRGTSSYDQPEYRRSAAVRAGWQASDLYLKRKRFFTNMDG
jgi:hypothetical protein